MCVPLIFLILVLQIDGTLAAAAAAGPTLLTTTLSGQRASAWAAPGRPLSPQPGSGAKGTPADGLQGNVVL